MTRKVIWLIALGMLACTSLWSPAVLAVGLGGLALKSALNQTFSAEIELTNLRGLEAEEFVASLASPEDFSSAGIQRNDILLDLQFKVIRRSDGALVVAITSSKRILEPFLDFMLEIIWPSGRILREYTVLLDPPVFVADRSGENIRDNVNPVMAAVVAGEVPATTDSVESRFRPAQEISQVSEQRSITRAGSTLWRIAADVRPDTSISVYQTMLALQRANPEAFVNNNINLLKVGHVLRITDADEILSLPLDAAIETVLDQNSRFERYKRGDDDADLIEMDASRRRPQPSVSDTEAESGELRLVASSQSGGERAGTGDNFDSQALQDELAVVEESLDLAQQENAELRSGLSDLEAQVQTLNELITLKDNELAQLAEMLRKQQAASAAAPANGNAVAQKIALLLVNPLVLGGIGLLLVAGLASVLIFTRKQHQDSINDVPTAGFLDENLTNAGLYGSSEEDEQDVLIRHIEAKEEAVISTDEAVTGADAAETSDDNFPLDESSLEATPEATDENALAPRDGLETDADAWLADQAPVSAATESEFSEDAVENKLDLARAYIDMGDSEGAKSVLERVIASGTEAEIREAYQLLERIS